MDYARFNYVAQPGDAGVALMPQIGEYDKHIINWGYRWIPDAKTSDAEKPTLNKWIVDRANNPMYFYGRQTFNPIDPRAQTEDLGNDAMKASTYGVANLKRIVPNLITWTNEIGKDYDDLEELYRNVIGQWNRYNGHVKSNIGGVYETHKTYEQTGNVYTPVPKAVQQEAMKYLQRETFATPTWMLDENILKRIEHAGMVDRVRQLQANTLNQLLDPSRIARLIEAEAVQGNRTYTPLDMFTDLRNGIWSELTSNSTIDPYRRNLQRAYIERMEYLMKEEPTQPSGNAASRLGVTPVDVSQSDIRPLVRGELTALKSRLSAARPTDTMTRYHIADCIKRIDMILDPK